MVQLTLCHWNRLLLVRENKGTMGDSRGSDAGDMGLIIGAAQIGHWILLCPGSSRVLLKPGSSLPLLGLILFTQLI